MAILRRSDAAIQTSVDLAQMGVRTTTLVCENWKQWLWLGWTSTKRKVGRWCKQEILPATKARTRNLTTAFFIHFLAPRQLQLRFLKSQHSVKKGVCRTQWFSTGVPRKTSVPWKIVRCSAGNLISLTSVPSNTGRKSLVSRNERKYVFFREKVISFRSKRIGLSC